MPDATLEVGLDAISADHEATIANPNNALFRINNFNDVQRDVSSIFAEWNRTGTRTDIETGLRVKRVATSAGAVDATGMMGMMASSVSALADAFNSADRDRVFVSTDVVLKILHHVDTDTAWRFEVASKTRAPSYQELYLWLPLQATGGLADGRSYTGSLDLREERSREIAIGLDGQRANVTVSPQLFYKKVDDYIQGVPANNVVAMMNTAEPVLAFQNVDAEIWGADIAWKVDLAERVFIDGIATFVRGRRTDTPDNLYRLSPANASFGVSWQPNNWLLTARLAAYAKQDRVSAYNGEVPTPGYALSSLMANWTPTESIRFEARVDNLFNRTYQDHVAGTNRAAGSDLPIGVRLYGTERTVSMGVNFSF